MASEPAVILFLFVIFSTNMACLGCSNYFSAASMARIEITYDSGHRVNKILFYFDTDLRRDAKSDSNIEIE